MTVENLGAINGGGTADAIDFNGGTNNLSLGAAETMTGNVFVANGATLTIDQTLLATNGVLSTGIAGAGPVTITTGANTLTLDSASTYTGGTTLTAGSTVIVGASGAFGTNTVAMNDLDIAEFHRRRGDQQCDHRDRRSGLQRRDRDDIDDLGGDHRERLGHHQQCRRQYRHDRVHQYRQRLRRHDDGRSRRTPRRRRRRVQRRQRDDGEFGRDSRSRRLRPDDQQRDADRQHDPERLADRGDFIGGRHGQRDRRVNVAGGDGLGHPDDDGGLQYLYRRDDGRHRRDAVGRRRHQCVQRGEPDDGEWNARSRRQQSDGGLARRHRHSDQQRGFGDGHPDQPGRLVGVRRGHSGRRDRLRPR